MHHAGTMDLYCLLDSAQVAGDLFVQLALDYMFEHFSFARCKRGQARLDFGKFGLLLSENAVLLNRHPNGCKQVFIVHGLGEEITRAVFHCLDAFRNISGTG